MVSQGELAAQSSHGSSTQGPFLEQHLTLPRPVGHVAEDHSSVVTYRHDSATEAHLLTHRRMHHIARGMVGGAVGRIGLDAGIKHVLASRHPYPHLLGQPTLRQ